MALPYDPNFRMAIGPGLTPIEKDQEHGENVSYVGLRDGIIVGVDKIQGKSIATVKLWYKKQFRFVKVALSRMFLIAAIGKAAVEPTGLLVDFCVPRLSVN